jgi:hypothetical protein
MTALLIMLSPSSILPPPSSEYTYINAMKKNQLAFGKYYFSFHPFF